MAYADEYIVKTEKLTAIADSIREKTGETDTITIDEMPNKMDEVFEKGKKSQYDEFWDAFQQNGNRTYYNYGFGGHGWTDDTFKPKYNMKPVNANYMFASSQITNLVTALDKAGVELSFENTTTMTYMFMYSEIQEVGTIDTRKANTVDLLNGWTNCVTIGKIIFSDTVAQNIGGAYECEKLENIRAVEGVIRKNINFSPCKVLSMQSVDNLTNALMTITDGVARTFSLHADVKAKLTDEQIATITTEKGWTLA